MNTLENILIIAGISLDVFASMEIQGAMLQKVNKKTLLVVSAIVSLLQLMFFFGGYAAGYGIDRAGVWRNASWVGYILDTIIFALLGSRLIVKGIRREFVDETRSVITVKQYAKIIAVTTVYTLFAGCAYGLVGTHVIIMLALIVLCDEFELLTEYAAFGVHFGDNDFRCVQAGYAICGEVARMGAGNANLNGVFGLSGGGHGCGKQGCGHELEKMFHFHSS